MEKISRFLSGFMLTVLKVLLVILVFVSFGTISRALTSFNSSAIITLIMYVVALIGGVGIIKSGLSSKIKIISILGIALIFRIIWLFNINSIPTSDFKTIYEGAKSLLNGNTDMFWGTGYIARFPHLTIMVLYMAMMQFLFPASNLIAMKIVNLILGVLVVYLVYLIVNKLFEGKKYGLYSMIIAAIFPPLVTYTAVFCTENIAIPFYLASIYIFLLVVKDKKNKLLLIPCGIALSLGNLFRMVALIILIAYGIYILVYINEGLIEKIKKLLLISVSYFIILISVSAVLQATKITEYPLWSGSEPFITNVLKGTHYESGGRWNEEDAALPEECNYDYELIEEKSREIIKERLTTTPPLKLLGFYVRKFSMQWNEGDLSGVFWSQLSVPEDEIKVNLAGGGTGILQVFYVVIVGLILIGTFNRKVIKDNSEVMLFYLILCGYGAMYLITESQPRYSYIACWVFIILSILGIDNLKKQYEKIKEKNL